MLRRVFVSGLASLAACGGMAHAQDRSAATLLSAVERGDLKAARAAMLDGAPVDARDARKRTALLIATYRGDAPMARALIEAGADVNAKDDQEDSAFLYAGAEGPAEILKLTLAAGADLASLNRFGGTALIPAAHHGHVENVRILLDTKIDKDHVNKLGWTALLEAVLLGDGGPVHTEIVRLLVGAGANANIADRGGVTPLVHARRRGFSQMVAILERAGAH